MIEYTTFGGFYKGMLWDDFFSVDEYHPHVTIDACPPLNGEKDEEIEVVYEFEMIGDNGVWFEALVSPALTMETAKAALAAINNVTPDQIVIHEQRLCIAIGD